MITINSDALSRPDPSEHYLKVRHYLSNDNENVSIVVQAFGRADKTKTCIECILKYTGPGYKLYILDNGTPDDSIIDLYNEIEYENKELIKFTKNITGVFAVNKVLHLLATKYIAWINNDIVVTTNWLDNMLTCMNSDDRIGMIVPVSANTSNFQGEDLGGFSNFTEMQRKAALFNKSDPRKWEERIRLIPTATLYRREIFDVVGLYDSGFMHDFGDDDFTFRVRRAGYKLIVCGDTYVHHDHPPKPLTTEQINVQNNSRLYFKEKFKGVDAWDDTVNTIEYFFEKAQISDNGDNRIIAFDVKCGQPILDAKNTYRKQGYRIDYIKSITSDVKYYTDLVSISNEVVCKNIEQAAGEENGTYDVVIVGEPINALDNPEKMLLNLSRLKKEKGVIICSVKNVLDFSSFFNILDIGTKKNTSNCKLFSYDNVAKILGKCININSMEVIPIMYKNENESKKLVTALLDNIPLNKDKSVIIDKIMTEMYWLIII